MTQIYLILTLATCLTVCVVSENFSFVILHNNDIHGRFEETSRTSGTCKNPTPRTGGVKSEDTCVGGLARTAHEIQKFRKEADDGGSPVLYLNAGDTFVGTSWFAVHKWRICSDFLNRLKPDAASLGNHEFDFGVSALAPFVDAALFPIVAANLNLEREPSIGKISKSVVLNVSGKKVGIIGHLGLDTQHSSLPGAVIFLDVVESVRKEAEILDQAGVKMIIVLGHSGYQGDLQIAAEVPLVDVVIGGHTNTFLWNGPQPDAEKPEDSYPKAVTQASGKIVPVVQAYAYAKYLGVLNVTFDDEGDLVKFVGQPTFLDTDVPQEPDILDFLDTLRPGMQRLLEEVVGQSLVLLDATPCKLRECNFGNLIADALVYHMADQHAGPGWTDAPIGLVNAGTIRTTVDPSIRGGNVTRGDLMAVLPFNNRVVTMTLTGADLIRTLEVGARSHIESDGGGFMQVSGLKVVFDVTEPSQPRVSSVQARCSNCWVPIYEPVLMDGLYKVVTVSFVANGGNGHRYMRDAANKTVQDVVEIDSVIWYLGRHSPVNPEEQGRIEFVKGESEELVTKQRRTIQRSVLLFIVIFIIFVPYVLYEFVYLYFKHRSRWCKPLGGLNICKELV